VTTLADSGAGSLRQAILDANATPGDDTITFEVTGTISLDSALPNLSSNIDIQGPGADLLTVRRNTGGYYRIFTVATGSNVALGGLTISNGYGGIWNDGGTLTLNNLTVSGNSAGGQGGGIVNSNGGTLTLNNSTISNNHVFGGLSYGGGGISNQGATLTINNSTISGNDTQDVDSTYGGGIVNLGTLTLNNSTVSRNSASSFFDPACGGGIAHLGGTLAVRNTIIAGNMAGVAPDLCGSLSSSGYNLIGNAQGGSGFDPTDLLNVNPLLGVLQNNGGPTFTHALLPGSPALNAGDPDQLGTPDQRGVVRSGGVNIGAYQASASAFVLSAPDTVQAGVPFDVTVTAVDPFGQLAAGYTGTVTFATTDGDPGVVLPADYAFTLDDGGMHTFTDTGLGEITLLTPGDQLLTVTDTADVTLSGSAPVTVEPGGPAPSPGSPPATSMQTSDRGTAAVHRGAWRPGICPVDPFWAALADETSAVVSLGRDPEDPGESAGTVLELFRERTGPGSRSRLASRRCGQADARVGDGDVLG
jgi:hypothetical protein